MKAPPRPAGTESAEHLAERLRQERETFDQAKSHGARWFTLRLAIGYVAVVLLVTIGFACCWILTHPEAYEATTLRIAAIALAADLTSLVGGGLMTILRHDTGSALKPVTRIGQAEG